jgi:hypothetical protein
MTPHALLAVAAIALLALSCAVVILSAFLDRARRNAKDWERAFFDALNQTKTETK